MNKFYKYNLFYNRDEGASWLALYWWNSTEIGCPQYSINKAVSTLTPAEQLIYDEFLATSTLTNIDEIADDIAAQPSSTDPAS